MRFIIVRAAHAPHCYQSCICASLLASVVPRCWCNRATASVLGPWREKWAETPLPTPPIKCDFYLLARHMFLSFTTCHYARISTYAQSYPCPPLHGHAQYWRGGAKRVANAQLRTVGLPCNNFKWSCFQRGLGPRGDRLKGCHDGVWYSGCEHSLGMWGHLTPPMYLIFKWII